MKNKKNEIIQSKITIKDIVITLLISIICSLILTFLFKLAIVQGHSMDTSLYDKEKLILYTQAYAYKQPQYKDIIVIKRDDLDEESIIKRVIGTPGDKIVIKNNNLYINNKKIHENYIKEF